MKGTYIGLVAVLLVVVLAGLTYMFPPSDVGMPSLGKSSAPSPVPSGAGSPALTGQESTFEGKDDEGRTRWKLNARSVSLNDLDKKAQAKDVVCTFFDKAGVQVATLTAAGAQLNMQTMDLKFDGEVSMTSRRGEKLSVKVLRYDGAQKKFFGSDGVRMTRATSVLTGKNLIADLSMQRITVKGNVQAFIHSLALDDEAPSRKGDSRSPTVNGVGTSTPTPTTPTPPMKRETKP